MVKKRRILFISCIISTLICGCGIGAKTDVVEEKTTQVSPNITEEKTDTEVINSEKEQSDLNSESTEESKFEPIDWQHYEDHMQQEDVVDFKEYYNVLANEEKFIFLDTNKEITFDDFLLGIESDNEPDIEGIVILDLDNQNGKELIINIYESGGFYLILSRDSGHIYGKMMSAREFEELQNDGKYLGAGGAGDLYFRRMKIDGDGAEETLIGELHGKENEDGSVIDELVVDGVVVENAQEWVDENYSDPVSWIE